MTGMTFGLYVLRTFLTVAFSALQNQAHSDALSNRPAGMVAGVLSLGVNFLAPARNLTSVLQLKHRPAFSVPERTDYFWMP
jgi:hypothetical protein